ncbi:hypothetical protein CJP74_01670 [Psittacicella melopsittaci]|uniref:Uncharacterized protein n=1 Tax=Psittacicella melopsittaci TaxID=2028576 RepID=A0A3A1Y899_9GAMM|nr:hypothetical protein [Psittacicella melopsittaci]RIY33460.1 hypothetical protein CJP74_01670 [Psittacicella melopsittaci]
MFRKSLITTCLALLSLGATTAPSFANSSYNTARDEIIKHAKNTISNIQNTYYGVEMNAADFVYTVGVHFFADLNSNFSYNPSNSYYEQDPRVTLFLKVAAGCVPKSNNLAVLSLELKSEAYSGCKEIFTIYDVFQRNPQYLQTMALESTFMLINMKVNENMALSNKENLLRQNPENIRTNFTIAYPEVEYYYDRAIHFYKEFYIRIVN